MTCSNFLNWVNWVIVFLILSPRFFAYIYALKGCQVNWVSVFLILMAENEKLCVFMCTGITLFYNKEIPFFIT